MKNFIKKLTIIFSIVFFIRAESIVVESWLPHSHMFRPDNDLINGYILLNTRLIESQRFFGPIHLHYSEIAELLETSESSVQQIDSDLLLELLKI